MAMLYLINNIFIMNIRNIRFSPLSVTAMLLYTTGVPIGLYGKTRINFSSDFTYNKYHFGVLT